MIRGDLPPVGNTILTKASNVTPAFNGFDAFYVDSGTSALALAIIAAKQLHPEISKPEVIVPAYCCPDLVSAAVYANTQVVVVDISPNDPAYDLEQLSQAINSNTIAVIAVNFLGIKERLTQIKSLLPDHCHLIEDNAQSFEPLEQPEHLVGDMVITSFGRGKPVSLLGGGLCLVRESLNEQLNLKEFIAPANKTKLLALKIKAYNYLIKPQLYPLISRNPLLSVGETHYKEKLTINALDKQRLQWLDSNVQAYKNQSTTAQQAINMILVEHKEAGLKKIVDYGDLRVGKLLRYPVLCKSVQQRDKLHFQLNYRGLGCSKLYKKGLLAISGLPIAKVNGKYPNSEIFSNRLLTLPCHSSVTNNHLESIQHVFRELS